eukprot:Em0018g741a
MTVNMELYVGLSCFGCSDVAVFAKYNQFSLAPEWPLNYQLQVSGSEVSSTVGDSFAIHNGQSFSTPIKIPDASLLTNYAPRVYSSGWWFQELLRCQSQRRLPKPSLRFEWQGIQWKSWIDKNALMQSVVLAVRPL